MLTATDGHRIIENADTVKSSCLSEKLGLMSARIFYTVTLEAERRTWRGFSANKC